MDAPALWWISSLRLDSTPGNQRREAARQRSPAGGGLSIEWINHLKMPKTAQGDV
jgi:hypothetical protein